MIVKNEEKVLKRVLDCAKEFADEIIVVDTGSTDKTKEIAKQFTDKVFDFKWCNDFSKARNFSFSKATCDYQMWLDADDFITQENIEKIKKLKEKKTTTDVYMMKYCVGFYDGNSVPYLTYYRERLLKRQDNFQWGGFVHEAITPRGRIEYLDIEIEHHKEKKDDPLRNLKLYRYAKRHNVVFSPREIYYYSRELFYAGYISSCIKYLTHFLKLKDVYPPDNYGAHILLADCYMIKKQANKSITILLKCLKKHTPTSEICCKLGKIYEITNEKERAIFWYKSALSCPEQNVGFVHKDYANLTPYLELCKLLYPTNYEESKLFHQKAKEIRPNHPSVQFNEKFFKN